MGFTLSSRPFSAPSRAFLSRNPPVIRTAAVFLRITMRFQSFRKQRRPTLGLFYLYSSRKNGARIVDATADSSTVLP